MNYVIPIVYPSAISIWLDSKYSYISDRYDQYRERACSLPANYVLPDAAVLQFLKEKNYVTEEPLTVRAETAAKRKQNSILRSFVMDKIYPDKSFIKLETFKCRDDNNSSCTIYAACPELCFIHASKYLSLIELIKLGYDLCAIYIEDENEDYNHHSRKPVTSVERLRMFIDNAQGMEGVKKARRAIQYIGDNTNSPMETKLAILEFVPFSMGGFSIEQPELNAEIFLSHEGAAIAGQKSLKCDAAWRRKKVAVEYDSNQTHLDVNQHKKDKRRSTALNLSGYKLFTITAADMSDLQSVNNTFISLRKLLGMKPEIERVNRTNMERRKLLKYLRSF